MQENNETNNLVESSYLNYQYLEFSGDKKIICMRQCKPHPSSSSNEIAACLLCVTPTFFNADFSEFSLPDFGAGDGRPVRGEVQVKPLPCSLVREGNANVVLVWMSQQLALQQGDGREKPNGKKKVILFHLLFPTTKTAGLEQNETCQEQETVTVTYLQTNSPTKQVENPMYVFSC